jgi:hypothetical protein
MKAQMMKVIDINDLEKELFGVKIIGLRRPIFGMIGKDFISNPDKKEVIKLVKQFNDKFKSNPNIEMKLREDKSIQGVRMDTKLKK